jgi:hypothetical protein
MKNVITIQIIGAEGYDGLPSYIDVNYNECPFFLHKTLNFWGLYHVTVWKNVFNVADLIFTDDKCQLFFKTGNSTRNALF